MQLLNAEHIRAWDAYTIAHEPISSLDLMERAARACTDWLVKRYVPQRVIVLCGTGNNGGDGLAIARQLNTENGWQPEVWFWGELDSASEDFQANWNRLPEELPRHKVLTEIPALPKALFIDALMGTGLRRPLDGWRAKAVEQLNAAGIESVAIDLPSGLGADASDMTCSVLQARHTLTFQLPKTALLFRETGQAAGRIHVLDIGLHPAFQAQTDLGWHWTSRTHLKSLWRPRSTFEHKGTRGHLLLAAGSEGMMGAAVLAARAALRSGCGLLTVHAPSGGRLVLQTAVPEALFHADIHAEKITRIKGLEGRNIWAIGPGIGTDKQTQQWLIQTVKESLVPLVLDADALNLFAQHAQGAKNLVPGTIITPHPKEFDRLFGAHTNERDRLYTAQEQAKHRAIVIVLKGAFTRVVFPDGTVHFNPTGNPGLASGGTGDVLTGVIAALRAQSYSAEEAALLGTWIHGKAADLAAEASGITQLLASDVVAQLPHAFALLER